MKDLIKLQDEEFNETMHAIFAGLLLNGFIQGSENEKLNDPPLDFAKKEFDEAIAKVRKKIVEKVCDKMIGEISDLRKAEYSDREEEMWDYGYDTRIKEEKEMKLKILKELL